MKQLLAFLPFALVVLLAPSAHAWKPKTHIYIAKQAWLDAQADGMVTIHLLDDDGNYLRGPDGKPRELGTYRVDPEVLEALRVNKTQYFAGVVGPDTYPDTATGQMVIHPDIARPLQEGQITSNKGTDAWLRHLWDRMEKVTDATTKRKARAFVLGYLTHAAGDMFAHSLVNYYTGGPFALPENGFRHTVLEGYIGVRTPYTILPDGDMPSIAGLKDFIYGSLINARTDSRLQQKLLVSKSGQPQLNFVIPRFYSDLRNRLRADVNRFNEMGDGPQKWLLIPATEYKKHWIGNIEEGLEEWVDIGHRFGRAIVFHPDNADPDKEIENLREEIERYKARHLLPMNGAPKGLGIALNEVLKIKEEFLEKLGIPGIKDKMKEIERNLLEMIIRSTFDMSLERFKQVTTNPGNLLDDAFRAAPRPRDDPRPLTVGRVNRELLGIQDGGHQGPEKFKIDDVPALYNTLVMSKLILLGQKEVNALVKDLAIHLAKEKLKAQRQARKTTAVLQTLQAVRTRGDATLTQPNIMLGFIESMDGSGQWADGDGMVLARNEDMFLSIFKDQKVGPK
jgi:hypothetical protein